MKKSLFVLAAAAMFAAVSCGPDAKSFVVDGTVSDSLAAIPGTQVLIAMGDKIDTVALENGKFKYTGEADDAQIARAILDWPERDRRDRSAMVPFIPEGGKTLKIMLADSSYVNGSPLTDKLNAFQDDLMAAYTSFQDELREAARNDDEEAYDAISARRDSALKVVAIPVYKENNNNALGINALQNIIYSLSLEEAEELYALGGEKVQANEGITKVVEGLRAAAATAEGKPFADFTAKTLAGEEVKLSDYVGKGDYVMIDFWASWCGPCMRSMPELRETYDKYAKKGLKVIGVNVWEHEAGACEKCVAEKDMIWTILVSEDGSAAQTYGVTGIPTAVIFDPQGNIIKRGHPMEINPVEYFKQFYN